MTRADKFLLVLFCFAFFRNMEILFRETNKGELIFSSITVAITGVAILVSILVDNT